MTDEELIGIRKCQYLRIKKDNPILSGLLANDRRIAIYYEHSFHKEINDFIRREYDVSLFTIISGSDTAFIYAPLLLENIDESISFNIPDSSIQSIGNKFSVDDFYKIIDDSFVTKPVLDLPMILVSDPGNEAGYSEEMLGNDKMGFYCYYFENGMDLLNDYSPRQYPCIFAHPSPIRFHKAGDDDDVILFRDGDDDELEVAPCDRADWGDIETVSKEIQQRIERLYAMGVNEAFIRKITSLPEPKLSHLVITDDFLIVLPDYNEMEIHMSVLPKTLFFFYLRHTEGVLFKHLRDYRDELYDIYATISPSENTERMNRSIDDMVDSTKNAVNEHCSRIKAAFAAKFQDRLARQYYITGKAGEPKQITLDRSLVEDRSGIIMK